MRLASRRLVALSPLWLAAEGWALAQQANVEAPRPTQHAEVAAPRPTQQAEVAAPRPQVDAALFGSGPTIGRVREATDELLAREGFLVSWSFPDRLRAEEIIELPRAGRRRASIAVWIDLQSAGEAGLTFRDASFDRFVVRRLHLGRGLDEIAKEEIAHVVTSVIVALGAGTTPTLSRAEARVALDAPPRGEVIAVPSPIVGAPRTTRFEFGPWATARVFSREIPLTFTLELVLHLMAAAETRGLPGSWGGWLSAGYQLPASYADAAIALNLRTTLLRAGATWEIRPFRRISFRSSVGAGVDRIDYRSRSDDSSVAAAEPGTFLVPVARLAGGAGFAIGGHLTLALSIIGEFSFADVHYDLREPGGPKRVVVPFDFRPGLAGGATWRF